MQPINDLEKRSPVCQVDLDQLPDYSDKEEEENSDKEEEENANLEIDDREVEKGLENVKYASRNHQSIVKNTSENHPTSLRPAVGADQGHLKFVRIL